MLSFVVAVAKNGVIGKDNSLVWSLPDDLKRFKEITLTGTKTMIMGRKTFESLPKTLPGRHHVILTKNKNYRVKDKNVEIIHSIDSLKPFIESKEEYFVIGGGEIFSLLMPYAQKIYMTLIDVDFYGDTFFPKYNKTQWKITESFQGMVDGENRYERSYLIMEKNLDKQNSF